MYSSKLPISTSVRRPTNHGDGSTSFVGLNRPSAIPVTVRKANLFTPQTQKRPFQSGLSTAGKSYMSGLTTDKKFQRTLKPVADREEQSMMFDTLVEFIRTRANNQLAIPEAKKFFSSVSTTESTRIFQFLISRILPDFKITRLETDVPEALALLEYPFIRSVTKSALVSVTTRQAAVGLLAIFYWLIGLIIDIEYPSQESIEDLDEPTSERGQITMNILTQPDNMDADKLLFDPLYPRHDYQSKLEELDQIDQEKEKLEDDIRVIDQMIQEDQTLDEDIQKCDDYESKMHKYLETKKEELDKTRQEEQKLDSKTEERVRLKENLTLAIQVHELSLDEVKRDRSHVESLETRLAQIGEEIRTCEQRAQVAKKVSQDIERRHRDSLEKTIVNVIKLLELCESQDFESEQCTSRKMALKEWSVRLKKLPHQDLTQNEKTLHEFRLFLQKLHATESTFQSELSDSIADLRTELENIENNYMRYEKEISPKLRERFEQQEREAKLEQVEYEDREKELEAERSRLASRILHLKKRNEELIANLERERDLELKKRERVLEQIKEESLANEQRLKSAIEGNTQKIDIPVKKAEREAERWRKSLLKSKEDLKAVKAAARSLKKRLDLKEIQ